jgi:hypothetical protein
MAARGRFCSGDAEREGRWLKCPSRQRLARDGGGLGSPSQPPQVQVSGARMAVPPNFFSEPAPDEGSDRRDFLPPTRKPAVILWIGAKWGGGQ